MKERAKKIVVKLKYILPVFLLILGGASFYIVSWLNNQTKDTSSNATYAYAETGNMYSYISATGTVQTANYLPVTTSVNGIIKKVYVKEGDTVIKGQKLMEVTLDSEGELSLANSYSSYLRAVNNLASSKNSLRSAESTYLQKKEAFEEEKRNNSYQTHDERLSYKYAENEYLSAETSLSLQKASIKQLEIALNSAYTEYQSQSPVIVAPENGTVANIVAVEGMRIENSVSERSVQKVASIKQEGSPIASVNITELDILNIKVGQEVRLTLSGVVEESYSGNVVGIDRIGTQSNGVANYPVIIKFSSPTDKALPNMTVSADIILEKKVNALYVPTASVKTSSDGKYVVLISKDGSTEERRVKTGLVSGTNTEVTEGLSEGDQVRIEALPTSGFNSSTSESRTTRGSFEILGGPGGR